MLLFFIDSRPFLAVRYFFIKIEPKMWIYQYTVNPIHQAHSHFPRKTTNCHFPTQKEPSGIAEVILCQQVQKRSKIHHCSLEEERLFSSGKSLNEMSSMQLAVPVFLTMSLDKSRPKRASAERRVVYLSKRIRKRQSASPPTNKKLSEIWECALGKCMIMS